MSTIDQIADLIVDVKDFPNPGVIFRDISPLLASNHFYREACRQMARPFQDVDRVVGLEARGFLFGVQVALLRSAGFVMARQPHKLPRDWIAQSYETEYSNSPKSFAIQYDAISKGMKVLICDDVLATGGSAFAVYELLEELGAEVVGATFLIELPSLEGRKKLESKGLQVNSLLEFD